ncbi:MAG: hypothetical protein ACK57P_00155, partial [Planctomycetota bacterium]
MNSSPLALRLLEWVNQPEYRPSKPRAIQRDLKLSDEEYRELRRIIKSLVKQGRLVFGSNHLVYPPAPVVTANRPTQSSEPSPSTGPASIGSKPKSDSNRIVGIYRRPFNEAYGFVEVPRGTGIAIPDIFIPPSCSKDAMDGDT